MSGDSCNNVKNLLRYKKIANIISYPNISHNKIKNKLHHTSDVIGNKSNILEVPNKKPRGSIFNKSDRDIFRKENTITVKTSHTELKGSNYRHIPDTAVDMAMSNNFL